MAGWVRDCIVMAVLGLVIFNLLDLVLEKLRKSCVNKELSSYSGSKKYKLAPVTILSPLAVRRWIAQW